MKMDVNTKSEILSEQTEIKVTKRPFDVAFLMLPDEKLKHKRTSFEVYNNNNEEEEDDDEEIEVGNNQDFKISHQKYFTTQKQQIFDDPSSLIKTKNFEEQKKTTNIPQSLTEKSAFTKVNLSSPSAKELRLSPNLSISPDLTYQNSLSPSPPIRSYQQTLLSQNQLFKQTAYQNQFLHHHPPSESFQTFPPDFAKIRPYYNYHQQFSNQDMMKITPTTPTEIRSPAAAILTSLLPPSLAALSLPAQNVCAKCNISFRMTSDLVYHMRSHHKNDSMDMQKRRREEKLKCPVCAESFRERHHLTRHMTAHQDKDEDENNVKKKCV